MGVLGMMGKLLRLFGDPLSSATKGETEGVIGVRIGRCQVPIQWANAR